MERELRPLHKGWRPFENESLVYRFPFSCHCSTYPFWHCIDNIRTWWHRFYLFLETIWCFRRYVYTYIATIDSVAFYLHTRLEFLNFWLPDLCRAAFVFRFVERVLLECVNSNVCGRPNVLNTIILKRHFIEKNSEIMSIIPNEKRCIVETIQWYLIHSSRNLCDIIEKNLQQLHHNIIAFSKQP